MRDDHAALLEKVNSQVGLTLMAHFEMELLARPHGLNFNVNWMTRPGGEEAAA